jgi:formylglycine-generating enzyme required for sulfatase activity
MKNGFGLYDMAGNAAEWLWDSTYSEVGATTEYLDDNYKGPDLGLGTERYYGVGRFSSGASWDFQTNTSATSAGTEKIWFYPDFGGGVRLTDGTTLLGTRAAPQIGLRTVRGR